MKIKVKYFALFKEIAGVSEELIEIEKGKSLDEVLDIVSKKYGFKKGKNMVVSLNHDYVKNDVKLFEGDEVGIMLPSSGG